MNPSLIIFLIGMAVSLAEAERAQGQRVTIAIYHATVFNGLKLRPSHYPQYMVTERELICPCTDYNSEGEALTWCVSLCMAIHPECTHLDYYGHECTYGDGYWYKMRGNNFSCHLLKTGLKDGDEIDTDLIEKDDKWKHYDVSEERKKYDERKKFSESGSVSATVEEWRRETILTSVGTDKPKLHPSNYPQYRLHKAKYDCIKFASEQEARKEEQERLKEIAGRKLIMPARTRWNYHYEMIKRLVDLKQHLSRVCEEQLIRNVQNWGVLVQLIQVLAPFAKWIDVLQGQKYPTIMYALPCLKELLAHLDELTQQNILPELCDAITFWINDYFKYILSMKDSGFNATYLVATALHPSLARSLKDTVEEPQLFRARQEIQNLLHLEIEISPNEQTAVVADIPVDESCSQVFCGGLFPHLQKEILHERPASMLSSISLVDDEVHSYFKQLPNYSIIGNSSMFPNLSKLACDVLAIPAASAAVESVFSVCGHATSGRRHNLTVNLEKEVMIKVNKKFL